MLMATAAFASERGSGGSSHLPTPMHSGVVFLTYAGLAGISRGGTVAGRCPRSVHRVDLEDDGSRRTGKHALESRNDAQGRAPLQEIRPHGKGIDVPAGAVQNGQPAYPSKSRRYVRSWAERSPSQRNSNHRSRAIARVLEVPRAQI